MTSLPVDRTLNSLSNGMHDSFFDQNVTQNTIALKRRVVN